MTSTVDIAAAERRSWESLPPFEGEIDAADQLVIIAQKGGAKSTLWASLTLDIPSLVALDDKGSLSLPDAVAYDLPPYSKTAPDEYAEAVDSAIRWREGGTTRWAIFRSDAPRRATNRVILRVDPADTDEPTPHDVIFRELFRNRQDTLVVIDEISATGATPHVIPRWLRALSARGRTRGTGLWTCTQAAFGLVPGILIRNAGYIVVGPIPATDARDLRRDGAELAAEIAPRTGRFIVWAQGDRQPYRLFVPIPPRLRGWEAP
jgi:hypothetical protein